MLLFLTIVLFINIYKIVNLTASLPHLIYRKNLLEFLLIQNVIEIDILYSEQSELMWLKDFKFHFL